MTKSRLLLFMVPFLIGAPCFAYKVGLVLDKGGKDDKSFNSSAYEGALKAEKDLGVELKYVEASDNNAIENLHRNFAKKNYDLVIGIGFAQTEAVKKVAAQFPQTKFALVDGEIQSPNVRSLLFQEHEGSFLIGAIAALKANELRKKEKKAGPAKLGFIGGMDIPLIRRFALAYSAGAKNIDPKIEILENYIGVTGEAWNNPAKAKELALSQFSKDVEVIFVAAGASGSGVFDAAEEKKKLAIGVDSNQNWMKPGFILTSMLKRVDVAVFETIKQAQKNEYTAGIARFGLKDKGVDYAVDSYNEKLLSPEILKKAEELKSQILAGKIVVPDYYKKATP